LIITDPNERIESIRLTQVFGSELLLETSRSNGRHTAQVSVPSGIYFVTITDQQNNKRTEKIFVP
jgi:hypothetical protein